MRKYDANIANNITTYTKPNVYDNKYIKIQCIYFFRKGRKIKI